jgi:hypothetical protein
MENSSKLKQWLSRVSEQLNEQVWFQELKGKWEELDPQSRMYLKSALGIGAVLLVFIMTLTSMWNVRSLKRELAEKNDLINMIQGANEEMRRLKELTGNASTGSEAGGAPQPWGPYLESAASTAGIDRAGLSIGEEKPGTSTEMAKESMMDVTLKHVSIKQIVGFAFQLESGTRPVKIRNMAIDTKDDPEGYMDAVLALSAFNIK